MDAAELRQRRKAAGLTQAELGAKLHLHRDFIGLMERGLQRIAERTALAVTSLSPDAPSTGARALPPLVTSDPMEQIIERALLESGVRFVADRDGGTTHDLDFHLVDYDIAIEVKRMHSPRIADQMKRAENVIVAQGKTAVEFLAQAIRSGRFFADAPPGRLNLDPVTKRITARRKSSPAS